MSRTVTAEEKDLVERYRQARAVFEGFEPALRDFFMPLVCAALEEGDCDKAREIASDCPASSTKAYLLEAVRQIEYNQRGR